MTPVVRVYSRPGCHLCDEALEEIRALPTSGFELEVVDIEQDDELLARFLERIPVIELDGRELYDFHVNAADLARRIEASAGR